MAALDTFERSLSEKERVAIMELLKARTADLLAARSEDARLRLVEVYIEDVRELLHPAK